jgi:transcription initiation factor TFIID subunit 15
MFSRFSPVLFLSLALLSSVVRALPNPQARGAASYPGTLGKRLNRLGLQARAKGNNNANNNNNNNNGNDDDTSLSLDPTLINTASKFDGLQNVTEQGTAASATSGNNFINFCQGQALTNGTQNPAGSCNGIVMGKICSKDKMPSVRIQSPKNLDTIEPNTNFTFTLAANNMALGTFVNADTNYFSAPRNTDGQGRYIGHTHCVIQQTQSLTSTELLDSTTFAFFKGINTAQDQNGLISIDVPGLPAGTYRICTITTGANHQALDGSIAQRGHFDDCNQITVKGGGGQSNNSSGNTTDNTNKGQGTANSSAKNKTSTNNKEDTNDKGNGTATGSAKDKTGAKNNKVDTNDNNNDECKDDNQGTNNNGTNNNGSHNNAGHKTNSTGKDNATGQKTSGNGNAKDNHQKTIGTGKVNPNGQKTNGNAKDQGQNNNANTNGTSQDAKSGDKHTSNDTSCDT